MGKNKCARVGYKGPHSTSLHKYIPTLAVPGSSLWPRSGFTHLAQAWVRLQRVWLHTEDC